MCLYNIFNYKFNFSAKNKNKKGLGCEFFKYKFVESKMFGLDLKNIFHSNF